ncbi:general transcription factor II-I repeat domain-containing protein 2A [Trichonephila clavipes]|nr:general transcription factor II-I repeat domain-containing protein 2A [Trichonephila clavipes]
MNDRILKLAENVTDQQKNDINSVPFISLCLDESIDIIKSARLAVFARYCIGNIIKEELIAITSLLTTAKGTDICTTARNSLAEKGIDLKKIVSVTTDGAPNMRTPGRLHTRTRSSSDPKTNRDSSLNTTFYQSVTFHIDLAWQHCRRSCRCSGVKGSARKGRLDSIFDSTRCLEIVCGTIATPTSARIIERVTVGVHKCLPHDPSILSPRGLPGHSRPDFPRVGTFSCPLLPPISNGTLRTIHLASNTARRPACGFHPDDQASL